MQTFALVEGYWNECDEVFNPCKFLRSTPMYCFYVYQKLDTAKQHKGAEYGLGPSYTKLA